MPALANVFYTTSSSAQETSADIIKSDVEKTWSQEFSETFFFSFSACFCLDYSSALDTLVPSTLTYILQL